MTTVTIRADSNTQIGTGHFMRCLALASLYRQRGYDCLFAMQDCPDALRQRLSSCGCRLLPVTDDPADLVRPFPDGPSPLLVVDGYHFSAAYRHALAQAFPRILALDDGTQEVQLHARWVLNPSPRARPEDYRQRAPGAECLLGPDYALLRPEFLQAQPQPRLPGPPRLLLTLGGSDPLHLTQALLRQLLAWPESHAYIDVDVVLGPAMLGRDQVRALSPSPRLGIHWHEDVTDMASLMMQADLAISAAGSTLWELAYLKIPTLALVVVDNQAPALEPPWNQWFRVFDLRQDTEQVPRVLAEALRCLDDPNQLARWRQRLSPIGIARQTPFLPERVH